MGNYGPLSRGLLSAAAAAAIKSRIKSGCIDVGGASGPRGRPSVHRENPEQPRGSSALTGLAHLTRMLCSRTPL